ncbi:hypothetical protein [Spiroplasma alleghenense]|uniref:Uncharacterized protein n=1 Tax=Spiroplasma alleghenense TaxID=216931 RepID=A0A345Z326_9MOLU|nr:hypothetical protein [Spiroplasma alleghenense]AXK51005.1 hypothetical protein SALLE_v1c03310 [Spiroplasma alleghenense]
MVIWIVLAVLVFLILIGFVCYTIISKFRNYQEQARLQIADAFVNLGVPEYQFVNPELEIELLKVVKKEVVSIKNNFGLARNNRDWEENRIKKNCFNIVKDYYEKDSGKVFKHLGAIKNQHLSKSQILGDETISIDERNRLIRELENEISKHKE